MRFKRFLSDIVSPNRHTIKTNAVKLPSFIKPYSADQFFEMINEWDDAIKRFNLKEYPEAKQHIIRAKELCMDLDGNTPLIVGAYQLELSKFEKEIDLAIGESSNIKINNKFI